MELQTWMNEMASSSFRHLRPDGMYGCLGKEGHLRFAREVGYCIPDMSEQEQKEFPSISYGALYVRACDLKPVLSGKEWATILTQAAAYRKEYTWMSTEFGLAWRMEQMRKEEAGEPFEPYFTPTFEEWQKDQKKRKTA